MFSVALFVCGIVSGNSTALLSSVIALCAGFVIMSLGIIGEYIVRMFMIITHEPQYIIRTDTKKNKEVFEIEKEIAYSGRR